MRYFDIDPILKIDASFRSSLNICNIFYPTGPELEVFEGGGVASSAAQGKNDTYFTFPFETKC